MYWVSFVGRLMMVSVDLAAIRRPKENKINARLQEDCIPTYIFVTERYSADISGANASRNRRLHLQTCN